jgi:hypothetical protein
VAIMIAINAVTEQTDIATTKVRICVSGFVRTGPLRYDLQA